MTSKKTRARSAAASAAAGLCVTLMAAIAGCDSAPARVEPPPPKVSVRNPEVRQIVDADDYNGWIASPQTVDVRARVRGHVVKIHFNDGDVVKENQLLFELDPRPFQQELDRSSEQVNIYQAQLNVALVEEKRIKELEKTRSASQLEIEQSFAKARSLEAQVAAQKKEVDRRQQELDYSRITSPINGRIGRAQLDVGNLVNAGGSDPVLATIVAIDPVYIYFAVDERSLQRYQQLKEKSEVRGAASGAEGAAALRQRKVPLQFGLETEEGYPHQGALNFADIRIDPTTGTIEVRGEVPNPQGRFIPGSRVRIRVPISEQRPAVLVPDTAILSDQDKKYVLALDEKNVVHRRDVRLGKLLDDGMRVVLSDSSATTNAASPAAGLSPQDRIVTIGIQMARINYPVEPVETVSPAAPAATQPVAAR